MSSREEKELKPKFRFPEFLQQGGWKALKLKDISVPVEERVGQRKLTPVSISAGIGFVPQVEKFGRDISGNQYQLYTLVRDGDFVYNKGNSLKFPQGCIYDLREWGEVAAPNVFICFRLKNGFENGFFRYHFEKNTHGLQLKEHITSGARSNGLLNISKATFYGIKLPTPSTAEQQKIAACLSTIDDLITAGTQKLEALRAHKKGLMQQFFPAEGETVPRLRFEGFEGEWEYKTVSEFAKVTTGNKDTQNKVDNGEFPFFVRSQTVERIDSHSYEGEAVLTSGDGVGVGKNFHYINGKFDFHQRVYCIYDFRNDVSGKFFYQYFSDRFFNRVSRLSAKNSVDSVRMSMITEMPICIPTKEEQNKVINCLSPLEDLIDGQNQKVENLKMHKKALLQN
ncbi:MAG: restriction endonuclease subunit S, partial [Proteobacteria bacterium]